MSSTSTYIGFSDETRVSSRVTNPPGGAPKFQNQDPSCPKAVRVLKPPGGGSSICFGDDPVPVTKKSPAKPVAEEPAPSSPEVTEAAPESTPSTEDAPAEAATPAPTNGTSEEKSSEQTPVETPAPESKPEQISNGTTENGSVSYSRSNSVAAAAGSDVDFPAVTFEAEGGPAEAAAPSQPSQNGHAKETASNDSPAAVNGSSNDSSVAAKQNGEVSSPKASLNGHSNGTSESSPAPALQNGSKSEGTPTNTEVSPASEQITKKPPTPVRSNSKGEFFENPSETKQQQQHVARTMPSNHHMKSSIFIEEETHNFIAPPRKSEPSPVKENPNPFQQAPPQRVRQPPGGFSSKLW